MNYQHGLGIGHCWFKVPVAVEEKITHGRPSTAYQHWRPSGRNKPLGCACSWWHRHRHPPSVLRRVSKIADAGGIEPRTGTCLRSVKPRRSTRDAAAPTCPRSYRLPGLATRDAFPPTPTHSLFLLLDCTRYLMRYLTPGYPYAAGFLIGSLHRILPGGVKGTFHPGCNQIYWENVAFSQHPVRIFNVKPSASNKRLLPGYFGSPAFLFQHRRSLPSLRPGVFRYSRC